MRDDEDELDGECPERSPGPACGKEPDDDERSDERREGKQRQLGVPHPGESRLSPPAPAARLVAAVGVENDREEDQAGGRDDGGGEGERGGGGAHRPPDGAAARLPRLVCWL